MIVAILFQIFFSLKFEDQGEMRLQALRNLDAFPRAEEHLLKKTSSGAVGRMILIYLQCFNSKFFS